MRRMLAALMAMTLVTLACGEDDSGETATTISSREAPADGIYDTEQTPPPETTPDLDTPNTPPVETPTPGDETDPTTAASPDTSPSDITAAASEGDLLTTADTELGPILVGPEGMTLYVFLNDQGGESTCYDACAGTWPPLEADGIGAGAGVDEAMLGTVPRDDGTDQVTYNGWPLYHYASDSEPGDIEGQGVGDVWFVIDPSGEVVEGAG